MSNLNKVSQRPQKGCVKLDLKPTFCPVNRLLWFVRELQTIDPDRTHLEPFEMHELAQRFLDRLDDELEAETKARRQGRPKSKRQEELEAAKVRDALEYERQGLREFGLEIRHISLLHKLKAQLAVVMPDLSDKVSIISLRYWLDTLDGRSGYLK